MEDKVQRIDNVIYGPRLDLSLDNKGVGRTIFDKMQKYRDRIIQIDVADGRQDTYEEVLQKTTRAALHMKDKGIKRNDVILMCSQNSMDTLIPVFSTLYLNAITATLDPSISLRDSIHLVQSVAPKLIFVTEDGLELIENAIAPMEVKPEIVVMGVHASYATLYDFLKPHPNEKVFVPDYAENMDDTAFIFFSSGSTGLPKGICISHNSILKQAHYFSTAFPDNSTVLLYTSFYWVTAPLFALSVILNGGKRIVATTFGPETFLEYVQKYNVTYSFLSSTYILQFNDEIMKTYKKKSLTGVIIGGSAIAPERMEKAQKYFSGTGIYNFLGQTEAAGGVTGFAKSSDALAKVKHASCGMPYFNFQIKISDVETGKPLGPYEKGEICIKTSTLCSGYYNKVPEVSLFDDDGFFRTGDVAYYDEDNCFYFCGRLKEMFKYQSWHIVPASVETVICQHPAVQEAVVIGIPHEMDDHHPLALITIKDGYNVTEEELLTFVNDRVLDREKLRAGLRIVKKFPRTCTGKVSRLNVKQMVLDENFSELN